MITPLVALAALGLPGAPPLPRHGWGGRLGDVAAQGLTGLLVAAAAEGHVDLADDEAHRSAVDHGRALAATVAVEAQLVRLRPLLDTLGPVVLKGPALAHGAWAAPELRTFTDLDLLAQPGGMGVLIAALGRWGYRPAWTPPAPGYLDHVAKAVTLQHPSGLLVDVHRTLATGHLGDRIDVAALHRRAGCLEVAGVAIRVPAPEDHLVATAVHAVVGDRGRRPRSLRDVAQLLVAGADPVGAVDRAMAWGLGDVLATALTAAAELGVALPPAVHCWLADRPTTAVDEATRRALASDDPSRALRHLEVAHARPRHRLTLLRANLAPARAFVRGRYGPGRLPALYVRHWRRVAGR